MQAGRRLFHRRDGRRPPIRRTPVPLRHRRLSPAVLFSQYISASRMLRKDRVDGGKGGLIALIKDSLRYTELNSSPENV